MNTVQRGKKGSLREEVYERDGRACVECGSTEELTLDHKLPRAKGGGTTYENLQTMCARCNLDKGDTLPTGESTHLKKKPKPTAPQRVRHVRWGDLHPRIRAALLS